jgi:spore maturation protein CgeB
VRILSCVWRSYYGDPVAVNPNYVYFVDLLRSMGHEVCFFDHVAQARLSKDAMNDAFLSLVRGGRFDMVFVELLGDEFFPEVLDQAAELTTTVAFNSDDDFRWLEYSSRWYPHFRYSVTTYRHVFERFRPTHSNLVLSPWACGHLYDGLGTPKDIPVSFVGGVHAERGAAIERIKRRMPLEAYGHGTGRAAATPARLFRIVGDKLRGGRGTRDALKRWVAGRMDLETNGLSFEQVNALWNRSRISWTPLDLGPSQYEAKLRTARELGVESEDLDSVWMTRFQVKGRVFELGSSGTIMLCDRNPMIEEFYERGVEYDDFGSEDEFVEKARFYLAHEDARDRMARAYHDRTVAEHLWRHRFEHIFRSVRGD